MVNYDAWLEKPYQDQCRDADAFEAAIEEVMQEPEFDPLNVKTFLAAIDDACLYAIKDEIAKELQADYDPKMGMKMLGELIFNAVYDRCYELAEKEAIKRYNDNLEGYEP